MSMDPTSEMTLNTFFGSASGGQMDVTMAGDTATYRMPANLGELSSFVSFNDPGNSVKMGALHIDNLLGSGADIDLSSIEGPAETGPRVGGPSFVARNRNNGPGGMN